MNLPGKFLVPAFLLLTLSTPALTFAKSTIDFSNNGGTLSGTSAGLSLSGSTLDAVIGLNGMGLVTGDLGTVTFTTGALTSGSSLTMGGTFAAGGTFTINGNGTNGIPNGVLFSGTFSSPVSWTVTTLANGTHNYTLTGTLTGRMGTTSVNAVTVQLTINVGKGYFDGSTMISGGDTTIGASVPEPSTLALFGSGIIGLAGLARRKSLKTRQ